VKRLLPIAAILLVAAVVVVWWTTRRPAQPPPTSATDAGSTEIAARPFIHVTPGITAPRLTGDGGAAAAGRPVARGETVIDGKWGSRPGEFGRRRDPESNPEAPMALAAGAGGQLAIVDQINRRVQRFSNGKPAGVIPIGGDTVQDLAEGPEGRTVLLDRLADKNVQVYDRDGKLMNEAPIVGKGVPEGGGVTGVFTDDKGIYVEREHTALVRIADVNGNTDADRPELSGRPTRDGRLLISAALADRAAGQLVVRAVDRQSGQPAWTAPIQLAAPILHILLLDSDRQGMVYVAAATGHESPAPPYTIYDEAITVVRIGAGGAPRGSLDLPSFPTPDETFRPLSVDDSGAIYQMIPYENGVRVVKYTF
jgi:hypothetical protein